MHEKTGAAAEVYRHEIKYYINKRDAFLLRSYLKQTMHSDTNADENGEYWIRSLYFDTADNKDFIEKISGIAERRKLRIRIYNTGDHYAKLEIKNKSGSYIHKESMELKKEDVCELIQGVTQPLLQYNNKVANKFFAYFHLERLRPILLIDYERQAFLCPFENIRIIIDKNIRTSMNANSLYDTHVPMVPILDDKRFILEVKYHNILPGFLRRILSDINPQPASVSKYCLARQTIHI